MQGWIETWIQHNGLEGRVILTGFRNDVRRLLKASDFFALPTVYEGGCSQALLEAMEENLPIVVTDTSAVAEVIRSEHSGLLVPVGDGEALRQALARLTTDPELARRLADNGKQDAVAFSAERSFEQTLLRIRRAMASSGVMRPTTALFGVDQSRVAETPMISGLGEAAVAADDAQLSNGWYPLEQAPNGTAFRWMGREAMIRLEFAIDSPTRITLNGYSKLTPGTLETLKIFVDGRRAAPVDDAVSGRVGGWSRTFAVEPARPPRGPSVVRIDCSHAGRPSDLNPSSTDNRELSISITDIEFRRQGA
jgi:hypothetical protein